MAWFHILINDEGACGFKEPNRNNSKKFIKFIEDAHFCACNKREGVCRDAI